MEIFGKELHQNANCIIPTLSCDRRYNGIAKIKEYNVKAKDRHTQLNMWALWEEFFGFQTPPAILYPMRACSVGELPRMVGFA